MPDAPVGNHNGASDAMPDTLNSVAPDVLVALVRSMFSARAIKVEWAATVLGVSNDTAHRILSPMHPKARPPTLGEAVTLLDAAGTGPIAYGAAHDAGLTVSEPRRGADPLRAAAAAAGLSTALVAEIIDAQADGEIDDAERARILRHADGVVASLDEARTALRVSR